jgi:hypothetical protein
VKETGKETLEKAKTVAQRVAKTTMEEAERQGITLEALALGDRGKRALAFPACRS